MNFMPPVYHEFPALHKRHAGGYNGSMGNNPVLSSAQIDKKEVAGDEITPKLKAVREDFLMKLYEAQKNHREKINDILRTIDERKIRDLKEKLKSM